MIQISDAINLLKKFKNTKLTQTCADYLISRLEQIDSLTDLAVESLANQLNNWIKDKDLESVSYDNLTFNDVLYKTLLALASAKPVNKIDPVTQEAFTYNKFPLSEAKLSDEDKKSITRRIVISTRHQFDIATLAQWIRSKGKMVNPFTGATFNERDVNTIKNLARELSINLASEHKEDEPHPALLAGAIHDEAAVEQSASPNIAPQHVFFQSITNNEDNYRLFTLGRYINNFNNGAVPALSVEEAKATTVQQCIALQAAYHYINEGMLTMGAAYNLSTQEANNLASAYPYIQAEYLTLAEARALTEAERQIIAQHGGPEILHNAFEQLQTYRANHGHGLAL